MRSDDSSSEAQSKNLVQYAFRLSKWHSRNGFSYWLYSMDNGEVFRDAGLFVVAIE